MTSFGITDSYRANSDLALTLTVFQLSCIRRMLSYSIQIPACACRISSFLMVSRQVTGKAGSTSLIHTRHRNHVVRRLLMNASGSVAPGSLRVMTAAGSSLLYITTDRAIDPYPLLYILRKYSYYRADGATLRFKRRMVCTTP